MNEFNLVSEPWLPVIERGRRVEVSLERALTEAHLLEGLATGDVLESVAVFRQVLLPVAIDALGLPGDEDEWARRWERGRLDPEPIAEYLHEHRACFRLLDATRPFAQVADLEAVSGERKPVSVLLPTFATGNNVPLFDARTEANPPELTLAQAARAVLVAHCWDTAGLKTGARGDAKASGGKTYGNPPGPVGQLGLVLPLGRTLAETLLLNMPIPSPDDGSDDRPQWRRAAPATAQWEVRPARGLLDLLTWQARRVRLFPETRGDVTVVREALLTAGDRLEFVPEDEPHTLWQVEKRPDQTKLARRPRPHQPGRSPWTGMDSLLARHAGGDNGVETTLLLKQLAALADFEVLAADYPLRVLVAGVVYGQQRAVIEDVIVDELPLPVAALAAEGVTRKAVFAAVSEAERLRRAADDLAREVTRAAGGGGSKATELGPILIHALTPLARSLFLDLQRSSSDATAVETSLARWRDGARKAALAVARPVLEAAVRSAFRGRKKAGGAGGYEARPVSLIERTYRRKVDETLGFAGDTVAAAHAGQ